LTSKLIQLLGDPYQSSASVVRRFSEKNFTIYVEYERERDEVNIEGFVGFGAVTLGSNDAIVFLGELQKSVSYARSFRISMVGNVLTIFPRLEVGVALGPSSDKQRITAVTTWVRRMINDLERIQVIITRFKSKEVGFSEIDRLWHNAIVETVGIKKGRMMEKLFLQLIAIDGDLLLVSHNVRTASEEIDIVLQPHMSSPFWSKISPPMILLECKNWKKKVRAKDVRDFAGKIENRPKLLCRIGFIVATNGFTKDAQRELIGYRARDFMIATLTKDDIAEMIRSKTRLSQVLERRLVKAGFR
jgi:hypothetical protein